MTKRDFLSLADFAKAELDTMIDMADKLKQNPLQDVSMGKQLAMIFEKSSTRTRVSFEAGINQLGGQAIVLNADDMQLGRGESIEDTAKVLSRFVDIVMIRANKHDDVVAFAKNATVPVINGLTDYNHPCQVLTDIFTFIEHKGDIEGKVICWVGDGNNMCNSWLHAALKFKFKLHLALKEGYYPDQALIDEGKAQGFVEVFDNACDAAKDADLVTTDTWVSMGDKDAAKRLKDFAYLKVTEKVMSKAKNDAIFMHCLPAHRGEEVEASVIDGDKSVVFDEAENRLHIQKAIMVFLLATNN